MIVWTDVIIPGFKQLKQYEVQGWTNKNVCLINSMGRGIWTPHALWTEYNEEQPYRFNNTPERRAAMQKRIDDAQKVPREDRYIDEEGHEYTVLCRGNKSVFVRYSEFCGVRRMQGFETLWSIERMNRHKKI